MPQFGVARRCSRCFEPSLPGVRPAPVQPRLSRKPIFIPFFQIFSHRRPPRPSAERAGDGPPRPHQSGQGGFPYYAEDTGRQEVTHKAADAFKFRALTLRQLKDARTFFHTKVRDVVEYFNAGIPQDLTAGAAPSLSTRFTNPRGTGYPTGLG